MADLYEAEHELYIMNICSTREQFLLLKLVFFADLRVNFQLGASEPVTPSPAWDGHCWIASV